MRYQPMTRRVLVLPVFIAAFGLLLTACGSSAKPPSHSTGSPAGSAASSPASGTAEATIRANWEAFFSAKTPTSRRVALLQNGSQFESLIAAQSGSSLASAASAKVDSVSSITSSQATVVYDIVVSGTPALRNQKGIAVHEGGTWKVGDKSFCALLGLEKSSGLVKIPSMPAACSSAG